MYFGQDPYRISFLKYHFYVKKIQVFKIKTIDKIWPREFLNILGGILEKNFILN